MLAASLSPATHALLHVGRISFLPQPLLLLLERDLNLRLVLGSFVRNWLENLRVEVELCLDSREVLQDELLGDAFVDLAVVEADHLKFVHVSVDVLSGITAALGEALGRGEGLVFTCQVSHVQAKCISLDLEAERHFKICNVAHE